jgi:hypothetical protein
MKLWSFLSVGVLLICFSITSSAQSEKGYEKRDLQKLKWIEGNWEGLYQGKPFYEIYRFQNDTTLAITSYEWNGKDSMKSSTTWLRWQDGSYFLGDSLNWKIILITADQIQMIPHRKAANEIIWRRVDEDAWDAILTTKRGEVLYNMKRAKHFSR